MKPTPIELEMPMGKDINGVEHRESWKAYDIDEVDSILAEKDAVIAELKQKLEDAKATAYTESVDAGMKNRKLKRALWIARARSAHNAAMMWEILSDEFLNGAQFTIDFRCIGDPDVTEFQMFRGCMDWMEIYENVERKCRAKAEEWR